MKMILPRFGVGYTPAALDSGVSPSNIPFNSTGYTNIGLDKPNYGNAFAPSTATEQVLRIFTGPKLSPANSVSGDTNPNALLARKNTVLTFPDRGLPEQQASWWDVGNYTIGGALSRTMLDVELGDATLPAYGNSFERVAVWTGVPQPSLYVLEAQMSADVRSISNRMVVPYTGLADTGKYGGFVTKDFVLDGVTYQLKTHWWSSRGAALDAFTPAVQSTLTVLAYEAAKNVAGANPFAVTVSIDSSTGQNLEVSTCRGNVANGFFQYLQMGKVPIDTVQNWIINDLVLSNDFDVDPRARPPVSQMGLGPVSNYGSPKPLDSTLFRSPTFLPGTFAFNVQPVRPMLSPLIPVISNGGAGPRVFGYGKGVVAGHVTILEVAAVRRVRLFDKTTGTLLRQQLSGIDGSYRFENVDENMTLFVLSDDSALLYNAVVADEIKAVVP